MHATVAELLELRDGDPGPGIAEHVAACPECAAELDQLRRLRDALAGLPVEGPGRDLWPTVVAAAVTSRRNRRLVRGGWIAAALAALVTLVVGVRGTVEAVREARLAQETRALVAQSQRLERQLAGYERRSAMMTGREAAVVTELEDRLALLDARLATRPEKARKSADTIDLWQQRVELLDALVETRATRATFAGL